MRSKRPDEAASPAPSMIDVRDVSHVFGHAGGSDGRGNAALRSVSFSLRRGEFLFLTGPSGAGKTTLLRLLHGSLRPQRGDVSIAGFDLNRLPPRRLPRLRREVAVVFQDFKVLREWTVFQNVAMALEVRGVPRGQIDRRVRAMLRVLHLEKWANAPCGELSGGEQQRVAIARAMVVNPKVVLADEPTGNLDAALAFRILDVFKLFNSHGATFVMATHNRDLVASFPAARILHLAQGTVTAANWPGAMVQTTGQARSETPNRQKAEAREERA